MPDSNFIVLAGHLAILETSRIIWKKLLQRLKLIKIIYWRLKK